MEPNRGAGTPSHFEWYCNEGGRPLEYAELFDVPHERVDKLREIQFYTMLSAMLSHPAIDSINDDWTPILFPLQKKRNPFRKMVSFQKKPVRQGEQVNGT